MSPDFLALFASPFMIMGMALALDMVMGEPSFLWSRLPHPVVLFGKAISFVESRFNKRTITGRKRRILGILAIILWVSLASAIGLICTILLSFLPFGIFIEVCLVAILLAGRSLYDHIDAVMQPLKKGDLDAARYAVSMIVGRDTRQMGQTDIAKAAIETGAENLSDGVIAPAIWYLIGGLPLLFAYKMINTADSMVGYKSARFYAFGWGAAMLDDVANFFPARLTALLIIATSLSGDAGKQAKQVMKQDADKHASPNAGYPESAMAGTLGIRLGGPRYYKNRLLDLPFMNANGRRDISASDIDKALQILWFALGSTSLLCLLIGITF